ncbi:hypothetical protein NMG60_11014159 [Bertholletia excelsa]
MGDSETVVAQTSAVMGYTSAGYSSTDYGDTSSNATTDAASFADEATGVVAASTSAGSTGDLGAPAANAIHDGSNVISGPYSTDLNSAMQGASAAATNHDSKPSSGVADSSENLVGLMNMSVDASQVASYESSINGMNANEAKNALLIGVSENGNPADDSHPSAAEHRVVDGSALSGEEERLWSIVRTNSLDFNAWTALIEETERVSENNILKIRRVYDAFLAEFPLCYGYWKKYADHESRLGSIDKVVEVYERAVHGVTYSVDIWLHYCIFAINTYGDPETIRRLFDRGLAYVGTDYLSFPLWDKYIEYEYMQQDWSRLALIYTQILENPNQQLDRYFNSFKEFAASRPLSEIRTAEEASAAASVNSEATAEEAEGEVHPNALEQSPKPLSGGPTFMCGPSMLQNLKIGITTLILSKELTT